MCFYSCCASSDLLHFPGIWWQLVRPVQSQDTIRSPFRLVCYESAMPEETEKTLSQLLLFESAGACAVPWKHLAVLPCLHSMRPTLWSSQMRALQMFPASDRRLVSDCEASQTAVHYWEGHQSNSVLPWWLGLRLETIDLNDRHWRHQRYVLTEYWKHLSMSDAYLAGFTGFCFGDVITLGIECSIPVGVLLWVGG